MIIGLISKYYSMLSPLAIKFGFKDIRIPKGNDSPRLKHHVLISYWVPSPPFMLFFDTELPKATNSIHKPPALQVRIEKVLSLQREHVS